MNCNPPPWTRNKKAKLYFIFQENCDRQSIHLIVILVLKGKGPFVNPTSGSKDGGVDPTQENLKFFKMLARKRKFDILAIGSPRHFLLPNPNGLSISSFLKCPLLSMNLSGLEIV